MDMGMLMAAQTGVNSTWPLSCFWPRRTKRWCNGHGHVGGGPDPSEFYIAPGVLLAPTDEEVVQLTWAC